MLLPSRFPTHPLSRVPYCWAGIAAWILSTFFCATLSFAQSADEVILDDFEGASLDGWTITGTAFGTQPARGTLPNQMHVEGYLGKGYLNSYHEGDGSIGTLRSKEFVIERPYINFLIGGGAYPNQTCIRLRVDGKTVLEAVGPNRNSGGSERLQWNGWDVRPWLNQKATIEIVDDHVGGWGHICIDHIVQSNSFRGPQDLVREIVIDQPVLMLPVDAKAPLIQIQAYSGDTRTHQLDITLGEGNCDFFAPIDVRPWLGKTLRWTFRSNEGDLARRRLDAIQLADSHPSTASDVRPRYHFTAQTGWLNDPNGLVYYEGEWHLYFQHNPVGWNWGNMHWGHATSKDLLHWTEHADVFRPWVQLRGAAFSGSAVVDVHNHSGWGRDGRAPLIAALTDTDAGESIAYSLDGFQWSLFERNPVVKHAGRDPRLLWHEGTQRWIMAVYDEADRSQNISFYSSTNFRDWKFESRIDGFFECPDLFELKTADGKQSRWVLYAADGQYMLGQFDGHAFHPDAPTKQRLWWGNFYAAQTFSNAPDGRRIQVGWGQGIEFRGERFNQQMCIPVELSLKETDSGLRMVGQPIEELDIAGIRYPSAPLGWRIPNDSLLSIDLPSSSTTLAMELVLEPGARAEFQVRNLTLLFDHDAKMLSVGDMTIPIRTDADRIPLVWLIDRGSLELFIGDGDAILSKALPPNASAESLRSRCTGTARVEKFHARDLSPKTP